jgi:hypothetical protein
MAKKTTAKPADGQFRSPFVKSRWDTFEEKARRDNDFAALFSEYRSVYNPVVIDGIKSLIERLKFIKEQLDDAQEKLPSFVNPNGSKPRSKAKPKEGEEVDNKDDNYDDKAWDRYYKILDLYVKVLEQVEKLKKMLTKSDLAEINSGNSIIGMMNDAQQQKELGS